MIRHDQEAVIETIEVNGVRLAYDDTGQGAPVVCVHGSWTDRHAWDAVAPPLSERYRVITYDRRGHSQSERPADVQTFAAHVADLAALITVLDAAPAHLLASSYGGLIALGLAATKPDRVASVCLHEPPLFSILGDEAPEVAAFLADHQVLKDRVVAAIRAGRHEAAARRFVETIALGPGAWKLLPADTQRIMTRNAPTFLGDADVPLQGVVADDDLRGVIAPVLLTVGGQSPPPFPMVVDHLAETIPRARRSVLADAGHIPHRTHPDELADVAWSFLDDVTRRSDTANITS